MYVSTQAATHTRTRWRATRAGAPAVGKFAPPHVNGMCRSAARAHGMLGVYGAEQGVALSTVWAGATPSTQRWRPSRSSLSILQGRSGLCAQGCGLRPRCRGRTPSCIFQDTEARWLLFSPVPAQAFKGVEEKVNPRHRSVEPTDVKRGVVRELVIYLTSELSSDVGSIVGVTVASTLIAGPRFTAIQRLNDVSPNPNPRLRLVTSCCDQVTR